MTNDFTVPPQALFANTNKYIDKIHDIFYQHWEVLNKERQALIDTINNWCSDQKKQINKYAEEQTVRLNENYNRLRHVFDEKHKENLETANAFHHAQQLDLFNELRDVCQSLKFQVSTLEFCKYEMERPKVIILEEQVEKKNSEEINTSTRDEARRRRRLQKTTSGNPGNSSGTTTSPSPNSVTTNSKQSKCVCPLKQFFVVALSISFIAISNYQIQNKKRRIISQSIMMMSRLINVRYVL